ncbi:MAG: class I SAM-dependent methyltransferase [Deltaproteobacteria bacterium]|nr:MAG: class I SAM-dependent methyltransferase [Deltaproteobacteria bacterium]
MGRGKATAEDVRRHYDRHPFYLDGEQVLERVHLDTPLGRYVQRQGEPEIRRAVDVGCGGLAKNLSFLQAYAPWAERAELFGTDLSRRSLELAKKRHPDVHFLQAETGALPFDRDSVDFVAATGTVHCMVDPERGIRELIRVTRPGHSIYLSVYNRRNLYFYVYRATAVLRVAKRLGLDFLFNWILVPLYGVLYRTANVILYRRFRRIPRREIEMDFHDKFMVPIVHFYTLDEIRGLVGDRVAVYDSEIYGGGLMIGVMLRKIA